MRNAVSKLNAVSEMFIHYTYLWHIRSIQFAGLCQSRDGLMGPGIYCCRADDPTTCNELIEFLAEEINWDIADKHFPVKERTVEEAMDFIHPIYFEYSGTYYFGEQEALDIAGYALIPKYAILPTQLVIGCPVNSGIKPEFIRQGSAS